MQHDDGHLQLAGTVYDLTMVHDYVMIYVLITLRTRYGRVRVRNYVRFTLKRLYTVSDRVTTYVAGPLPKCHLRSPWLAIGIAYSYRIYI